MEVIKKVLKSRTTYTVIALVVINTIPAIKEFIPEQYQEIANAILGLATLYFKFNPRQEYGPKVEGYSK